MGDRSVARVIVTAILGGALLVAAARGGPAPGLGAILFERQKGFSSRLFTMQADGSAQRPTGLPVNAEWSPRGRYMAYKVSGQDGKTRLYVADRAGRRLNAKPLVADSCLGELAWSPDETRLAYANYCDVDFSELFVIGRNGRGRRKLVRADWQIKPRWSPDGRTILFGFNPRPQTRYGWFLYVVRPDGSGLRRLPNSSTYPDYSADWGFSRDGSRVFMVSRGSFEVLNVKTGKRTKLAPDLQVGEYSLSPDGRRLAVQAAPLVTREARDWEIFTLTPDGSDRRQLTENVKQDGGPRWSRDGRQILFWSERDGNSEVYVMNADGTNQANLSRHPGEDVLPSWVPPRR